MRRARKVTLTWCEDPPEYFCVEYIAHDGTMHRKAFNRENETIAHFLERIGRTCVSAAKGDLT